MSTRPVLYFGDTNLDSAAAYLAGMLAHFGIGLDYIASNRAADAADIGGPRKLFILSDYPANMLSEAAQHDILQHVHAGAGLLMLGGWESFHGAGGDWQGSALSRALPVEIAAQDDRINCDQPALVVNVTGHPITAGLPWDRRPPTIGGYNRFEPRDGAQVLLEVQRFAVTHHQGAWDFSASARAPLLVVGAYGNGRSAALATDVAPHWVGGLVDWGSGRVSAQHPASFAIEVGDLYAQFFQQLVRWTGQL